VYICIGETVSIGLDTLCSVRHPLGGLEHMVAEERGLLH
jgi:hypothetical protein